jgi:hypothetical protein
MPLPTDAQREAWNDLAEASKESAEETEDLEGKERMAARAEYVAEKLSDDDGGE